jgi:uncharacterized membrane protein YbaN (DUF454 family)
MALTVVGFTLVAFGLAGLVLPVLPGWIMIIAGFAVLSREYSWADSCLTWCRRQAARSGTKLRSFAGRRIPRRTEAVDKVVVIDPSGEVVIDLTEVRAEKEGDADSEPTRSSQAR